MIVVLRDHRTLRRYTYTAMVVGLVLLVLPLVPVLGRDDQRRPDLDPRRPGSSFQPAELAKIVLAIFFAGLPGHHPRHARARRPQGARPPAARGRATSARSWSPGSSRSASSSSSATSARRCCSSGCSSAMLYVATERISWVVIGLLLFVGGAIVAAHGVRARPGPGRRLAARRSTPTCSTPTRRLRPARAGAVRDGQRRAASAPGSGQGRPDLVPYAESDFIVASLGEELGLTGLLAMLVLYLVLVQRGLRTAIGVRDGFGKLLAGGMAFVVALQCFVVVGGVTRVIPLTGLTMPFLAYGGSSLLANWMIVALLLRISDSARRPAPADQPIGDDGPLEPDGARARRVGPRDGGHRPARPTVTRPAGRGTRR